MYGRVAPAFKREQSENRRTDTDESARAKWRNVAIVMDRCFLILYAITVVITSAILFPR